MAEYSFKCQCGNKKVVVKSMLEYDLPVFCEKCSLVMTRDYKADFGKQTHGDIWPMASYAAGVSPEEVPEMVKFDKEHGVPTEYTTGPDGGDPVFTSRGHRAKYLKIHGLHDRQGGYSD